MKERMAEIRASCTFQGGNNMADRMKMAAGNELPMANRQYKARLFEMIFSKKKELELKVTMLNINRGHNSGLMSACKTLADYAEYTARVREYAVSMPLEEAVERAITECISKGILADFLSGYRAEAKKVTIYEYNEEEHMRMEREENFENGRKEERARIYVRGICKKIKKNNTIPEIADMLELDEETARQICDIAKDYAPEYDEEEIVKKYLKLEAKRNFRSA